MKKIFFASITILILSVVTCQAADYLSPVNASLTKKEKKALDLQDQWEKGTLEPVTVQNGKTCFGRIPIFTVLKKPIFDNKKHDSFCSLRRL